MPRIRPDGTEPTWILTNVVPVRERDSHIYVSTACMHGRHEQCGVQQLARGDIGPPHCKHCPAVCACLHCRHADQAAQEQRLLQHIVQQPHHVRRPGSAP